VSTSPSTARRLRRYTAGAALVLFPALLVPEALIDPAEGGTGEVMYRAATESAGSLTTSAVLLMVSGVLLVPAVSGVLRQARDRGAGIANLGAALAVLGGFGHFGIGMYYLIALPLVGGGRGEMIAYIDRLNETAAIGAITFPLIFCFGLGVMILPWAAWRAGVVHWWVPAVVTAAALAEMLLPFRSTASDTVILTVVTVGYAALGLRVLRSTDAEWDGVPQIADRSTPVAA
jgi:hypothetical protein